MKKIYFLSILLSFVALLSCSKDFLKKYDKRIVGTWQITKVNTVGFGGNLNNLPFTAGIFIFSDGGGLTYTSASNQTYQGNWDIVMKTVGDESLHSLEVTVVDYSSQQALSEHYDDINFTATDRFKANVYSGFHTYVTHFNR